MTALVTTVMGPVRLFFYSGFINSGWFESSTLFQYSFHCFMIVLFIYYIVYSISHCLL